MKHTIVEEVKVEVDHIERPDSFAQIFTLRYHSHQLIGDLHGEAEMNAPVLDSFVLDSGLFVFQFILTDSGEVFHQFLNGPFRRRYKVNCICIWILFAFFLENFRLIDSSLVQFKEFATAGECFGGGVVKDENEVIF